MRNLKYWQLCLAIWLGIASLSCAQNKATFELAEDEKLIEFTTDRFTLPNLHVTPDGESIIFDVLGDIYKVPIEGGKAEVLLQDSNWKRAGKLSPDGKTLAYVSDETGEFQVWTMDLETKEKRVYPIKEYLHYPLFAYWKDRKHLLIPSKEGLQNFDVITGKGKIIRPALKEEKSVLNVVNRTMSVNKLGKYAFFQKSGDLWAYDLEENIDLFIESTPNKAFLGSTRGSVNGGKVVFYNKNKEDNSKQDLVSWCLSSQNLKFLFTTSALGNSTSYRYTSLKYSFDFIDDTTIILDKEGEIVRMNIETGEYEPIPIEVEVKKVIKKPLRREPQYIKDSIVTASVLRNPVTRKDLDTIYFGAFGKLHSYAKDTEQITEIYPEKDRFEVSPSLSPNGKYLAYTTWNDTEMGHVYARELKTGKEYQLTKIAGRYINPAWSSNGREIVFISDETEEKFGIRRLNQGSLNTVHKLNVNQLKLSITESIKAFDFLNITTITPFSNSSKRFYPIPVFHPNSSNVIVPTYKRLNNFPVLNQIDVDGSILSETPFPIHTNEILISPDAKYIAFIFDEQVWIDSFPHALKLEFSEFSEYAPKQLLYKGGVVNNILLSKSQSIYEVAPSYLSWQDAYTLMWGSAEEIYTYDVRTGITEKIANIKVQKPRAIPKTQYALTNARIITMNQQDEIIEKGTILVKDNRIWAVGEVEKIVIPENYKVFDLEGKTIMPGLIDAHSHLHRGPFEFNNQQEYQYIGSLAYGVTTIYDANSNGLDYREKAQLVETGIIQGPRVFSSGNIIRDHVNENYYNLSDFKNSDRLFKSYNKIGVSGPIKDYTIRNSSTRKRLYKSAYQNNSSITTHQNDFIHIMSSIINGYTAIEHDMFLPIKEDLVKFISLSEVHLTPTYLVTPGIGNLYYQNTSEDKLLFLNGFDMLNTFYIQKYKTIPSSIKKTVNSNVEKSICRMKNFVSNDAVISVGGHGDPLPGIGMHWELWFLTNAMSNYKSLKAATIIGANKLDLQEELGTIENNKLADLIILNSDPLDDIFNTTDILYTILNGNIFDVNSMKLIYPLEKNLLKWGRDSYDI